MSIILPPARNNIVVQNAGKDLLVYDLATHKAYLLNETSAKVFNACNGNTSLKEVERKHQLPEDLIYLTLDELWTNGLIEGNKINYFNNQSRRDVIKKVGLATLVAFPVITAVTAPTAIQAGSGVCSENNVPCTEDSHCCSGVCNYSLHSGAPPSCCHSHSATSPQGPPSGSVYVTRANDLGHCQAVANSLCCSGSGSIFRYNAGELICSFTCN